MFGLYEKGNNTLTCWSQFYDSAWFCIEWCTLHTCHPFKFKMIHHDNYKHVLAHGFSTASCVPTHVNWRLCQHTTASTVAALPRRLSSRVCLTHRPRLGWSRWWCAALGPWRDWSRWRSSPLEMEHNGLLERWKSTCFFHKSEFLLLAIIVNHYIQIITTYHKSYENADR